MRNPKTTRQILETMFCNYSCNVEQEEILKSIVASAADQLALIADALESPQPCYEAASACLRRIEDQLRFAVEADFDALEDTKAATAVLLADEDEVPS